MVLFVSSVTKTGESDVHLFLKIGLCKKKLQPNVDIRICLIYKCH